MCMHLFYAKWYLFRECIKVEENRYFYHSTWEFVLFYMTYEAYMYSNLIISCINIIKTDTLPNNGIIYIQRYFFKPSHCWFSQNKYIMWYDRFSFYTFKGYCTWKSHWGAIYIFDLENSSYKFTSNMSYTFFFFLVSLSLQKNTVCFAKFFIFKKNIY